MVAVLALLPHSMAGAAQKLNMLADFSVSDAEAVRGLLKAYASFADVRFIVVGDNGYAKIPFLKEAGQKVDIALLDFDSLAKLDSENLFEPLDAYMTGSDKFDRATVWPAAWDAVMFKGKTYGVPIHVTADALIYNKPLFDKLGFAPPKTWEEFRAAAEKLAADRNPDGSQTRAGAYFREKFEAWLSIYGSRGGRLFDADGKPAFDNPAAVAALALLADLHRKNGPVPLAEPFGRSLSLDTAPMMILFDEDYDQSKYKDAGVAPVPSGGAPYANMRGKALVIFKDASPEAKRAAWKLIKVFAGENLQSLVCSSSGWLTSNRKLAKKSAFKSEAAKKPHLPVYYENLAAAAPFPLASMGQGQGNTAYDILRRAVMDALYGAETPGAALKNAAKLINDLEEPANKIESSAESAAKVDESFSRLPSPGSHLPGIREDSSPFGILLCLALRYAPEELEKVCKLARDAGIRWEREEFPWSMIEPEKGKFVWDRFDKAIAAADKGGIKMLGLLDYNNAWSCPFAPRTAAQRADFANYAYETVSRYKGSIKYWEIWNEENIGVFWWPYPNPTDYVALLREAYVAVKRADPTAQVLLGGTSGADLAWIDSVYRAGGGDYFDVMAFHPYIEMSALDDERYVQNMFYIRMAMQRYGGVKPAWLTEVGWPTTRGGITPEQQAANYAKMVAHSLTSGYVAKILPYDFRDDSEDPDYGEANFGIMTRDYSAKPAYRAYGFLANRLANYIAARRDDPAPGIIGYRFTLADGELYMLWTSKKGDRKTYSIASRGLVSVIGLTGVEERLIAPSETVAVEVENSPVYLFERKTD